MAIAVVVVAGIGALAYTFRDPPNERPEVVHALYDAVDLAGDGGLVDLGTVAPFPWDKVYVFPSYTRDEDVDEVIGIKWGTGQVFRLPNDGFHLLVFVQGDGVTGWTVVNDYEAEEYVAFDEALWERPIDRRDAVLRLEGDTLRPGHVTSTAATGGLRAA